MKKILLTSLIATISICAKGQVNDLQRDIQSNEVVLLTPEHFKPTVLVIDEDSIYNTFENDSLVKHLKTNAYKVLVYKNRDSINAILKDKIRAIIVVERKKVEQKN